MTHTDRFLAALALALDANGVLPLEKLETSVREAGADTPALALAFRRRAERALAKGE